jgi:hypothetical protein
LIGFGSGSWAATRAAQPASHSSCGISAGAHAIEKSSIEKSSTEKCLD